MAKAALPQLVADDGDRRTAFARLVIWLETATDGRTNTERVEVVRGHHLTEHQPVVSGNAHRTEHHRVSYQDVERQVRGAPVHQIGIGR